MKSLLLGIVVIIIAGFGGLVYRNALEYSARPIACPVDALVCPDGTSVSREGMSCTFPACPPPNVSLLGVGISFALPGSFEESELPDAASIAAYASASADSLSGAAIVIRRYAIAASSTALATIEQTALRGTSGVPVGAVAFSSTVLDNRRFTIVSIERFEGVVDTAYYLARGADVLRFDAIDRGVAVWTDSNLDTSTLPAHAALRKLLATLQ
ncbi:hypothetical protein HY972_03250 [Candidatus Kaiserbacteria bacterium]|nr:hypothetical protein [Candidatus Kaiserbacteria bacterium]